MNLKKAALFGLDMRITLVIFSVLSVITGAALQNAIKESQANQMLLTFKEIGKAYDMYIADTSSYIPFNYYSNIGYGWLKMANLIKNGENLKGWNGPYIGGEFADSVDQSITNPVSEVHSGKFALMARLGNNWTSNTGSFTNACNTSNMDQCYDWVTFQASVEKRDELFEILDEKVDNSDGPLKGRIRVYDQYLPDIIFLMYKLGPRPGDYYKGNPI